MTPRILVAALTASIVIGCSVAAPSTDPSSPPSIPAGTTPSLRVPATPTCLRADDAIPGPVARGPPE